MRILARFLCGVLLCLGAMGQDHGSPAPTRPVTLVTGLGDLHHPVSTKNPQAQQFFDQGLRFIYAFNHDEASNSTFTNRPAEETGVRLLFQRSFFRWRSSVLKLKPRLWQDSLRRIPLLTNSATNC